MYTKYIVSLLIINCVSNTSTNVVFNKNMKKKTIAEKEAEKLCLSNFLMNFKYRINENI